MRVAWNGDGAVDERADKGPDEAGDILRPTTQDLQAECEGVDVRAVAADDG